MCVYCEERQKFIVALENCVTDLFQERSPQQMAGNSPKAAQVSLRETLVTCGASLYAFQDEVFVAPKNPLSHALCHNNPTTNSMYRRQQILSMRATISSSKNSEHKRFCFCFIEQHSWSIPSVFLCVRK